MKTLQTDRTHSLTATSQRGANLSSQTCAKPHFLCAAFIALACNFAFVLSATGSTPGNWTWRAPTLQGNSLVDAAVSNGSPGTVVAVGEVGTILTKVGTSDWQVTRLEGTGDLGQVLWIGNSFLTAGLGPEGKPVVWRSLDGLSWSSLALPNNFDFSEVALGAYSSGRLVVITYDGTSIISTDSATSWSAGGSLGVANSLNGSSYFSALEANNSGVWVAVGTGGTVARSVNGGLNWTKRTIPNAANVNLYNVRTDGTNFIAYGEKESDNSYTAVSFRSSNGQDWSPAIDLKALGFSDDVGVDPWINNVFGLPGLFVAVVSGNHETLTKNGSSFMQLVYASVDGGLTWNLLELETQQGTQFDPSMVMRMVAAPDGSVHLFGLGGLVASLAPNSSQLDVSSEPYFGLFPPAYFTTAGANGAFIAVAGQGGSSISSPDGLNFSASTSWSYQSRPTAVTDLAVNAADYDSEVQQDRVLVGAQVDTDYDYEAQTISLVIQASADGDTWAPVDGIPPLILHTHSYSGGSSYLPYFFVVDLAANPNGSGVVLVGEQTQSGLDLLHLYLWNGSAWSKVPVPGFPNSGYQPWNSVKPKIEWNGQRFLLLTPQGGLLQSADGMSWTALPSLPTDNAAYLDANFNKELGVGVGNLINSFASNGSGTIVVRASKFTGNSVSPTTPRSLVTEGPDRFFVLAPNASAWTSVQPPAAIIDRYEGGNVVWNGSMFASPNGAGFLWTSVDGLSWTRRELGADVKVLTWTGTQFVGLTEYSSVITSPDGLSTIASLPLKTQTITFPQPATPQVFSPGRTFNVSATSSVPGLPVTISVKSGPATVSGNRVTLTGAGTVVLVASQSGNGTFAPAEAERTVVVSRATQTIGAFAPVGARAFGAAPFAVTLPVATSRLPVVLSVKSGPATVSGNTVTLTGAGTVVLAANQAGDANFSAAREVTTSFVVNKQNVGASIILSNTSHTFDGTAKGVTVATVPPGLATRVTYNGSTNLPVNAGTYTVVVTINNDPNYQGSRTATMTIAKATQTINFTQPAAQVFAPNRTFTLSAASSSGLPVTFASLNTSVVTIAGNVATLRRVGTATIRATQAGNANFNPAVAVEQILAVTPAN